jgi:CRISPR-associated protein Csm5
MRYKVTTLTPLLAGDGHELAPIDYMVWKDHVNVLDQPRIFKLLARGPRLDGYLAQLRRATKLDFASWGGFAQNFSQRRIPFENPESTAIWNSAPSESLFIPTFTADYRGAYLPGSALKGALRTSIVFSRWTTNTIDRVAAALEGDRAPRRIAESAEVSSGASQTRVVEVADSDPISSSAFKVFLTRVASLDTREPGKPRLVWKVAGRGSVPHERISGATSVFAEMAIPRTMFTGEWHERNFLENPALMHALGWRSVPNPNEILESANQHAAAQLELHARYAEAAELGGLEQSVRSLKQELNSAQETPGTCLLCLGWGSGFVAKAGFLQTEQESYRRILRAVPGLGKAIREGVPFPKTRRIVFTGGQPSTLPGWVKLQLER